MEFGYITSNDLTIRSSGNKGFIVHVGCREFAFSNTDDLIKALREYLSSPKDVAQEFFKATEGHPTTQPTLIGGGARLNTDLTPPGGRPV